MNDFRNHLGATAFVFRGYNVTNLGRSDELLSHPVYGSTVERYLKQASEVCSQTIGRSVNLLQRVQRRAEPTLETYDEAVSLIMAMEIAQIRLLEEHFGVRYSAARLSYGYSLGEVAALVAAGVYELEDALRIPLTMSADAVALAHDATLGVLFSRGPVLDVDSAQRLCLQINLAGRGVIGISSFLSPNSILIVGQNDTLDRFAEQMHGLLPHRVYLRKNEHRWPPLHTPLMWQRNIANRAAQMMHTVPGGLSAPTPAVLSLVTGKTSYNDFNSRAILASWVDHPQRLWDAIYETLAAGIETVVHVGPEPNLVPATFTRLGENVQSQLAGRSWEGISLRAVSRVVRRPWLARLLPTRSALLRAPFVQQIVLEDWLLTQPLP